MQKGGDVIRLGLNPFVIRRTARCHGFPAALLPVHPEPVHPQARRIQPGAFRGRRQRKRATQKRMHVFFQCGSNKVPGKRFIHFAGFKPRRGAHRLFARVGTHPHPPPVPGAGRKRKEQREINGLHILAGFFTRIIAHLCKRFVQRHHNPYFFGPLTRAAYHFPRKGRFRKQKAKGIFDSVYFTLNDIHRFCLPAGARSM